MSYGNEATKSDDSVERLSLSHVAQKICTQVTPYLILQRDTDLSPNDKHSTDLHIEREKVTIWKKHELNNF